MGFFQDLGLDELVAGINEFKNEMAGLKDDLLGGVTEDIVTPIIDQLGAAKETIQDIVSDATDAGVSSISEGSDTLSPLDSKD